MAYKAVFDGPSLYHINNNRWPAGTPGRRGGQFKEGDGDGDGQTEYQDSLRRRSDSKAARERLDSYYKNVGKENYESSKAGPSGRNPLRNPYIDKNGVLTDAGRRRFESEKLANRQKSKKNRVENEDDLLDPNKWVRDDIKNMQDFARASKDASNSVSKVLDDIFKTKPNERLDLSKMSDQEIAKILNRERLERQYNEMFNQPTENKGKEFFKKLLSVNNAVSDISIAGLTIATLIMALAK